tara:strand:+ start:91 stop:675 length:585 start_codon:yes stop_codon:yes gene_type:complete
MSSKTKKFKKKLLHLDMSKIKVDSDDEYINLSPSTTKSIFEYKNTEYLPINILWITNNISYDKNKISFLKSITKLNDCIKIFDNIDLAKDYFLKNKIDIVIIKFKFFKLNNVNITNFFYNYINMNQLIILSDNDLDLDLDNYTVIKNINFENDIKKIIDSVIRVPKIHLRSLNKKGSWSSKSYIDKFKNNLIKT